MNEKERKKNMVWLSKEINLFIQLVKKKRFLVWVGRSPKQPGSNTTKIGEKNKIKQRLKKIKRVKNSYYFTFWKHVILGSTFYAKSPKKLFSFCFFSLLWVKSRRFPFSPYWFTRWIASTNHLLTNWLMFFKLKLKLQNTFLISLFCDENIQHDFPRLWIEKRKRIVKKEKLCK